MTEFVNVTKDGECMEIHASTLEAHKYAGWSEILPAVEQPAAPAEPEAVEQPADPAAS